MFGFGAQSVRQLGRARRLTTVAPSRLIWPPPASKLRICLRSAGAKVGVVMIVDLEAAGMMCWLLGAVSCCFNTGRNSQAFVFVFEIGCCCAVSRFLEKRTRASNWAGRGRNR